MGIVLAFSDGLDTSSSIPYLREKYGMDVYTVTVNTGATLDESALRTHSIELGAKEHFQVDARIQKIGEASQSLFGRLD